MRATPLVVETTGDLRATADPGCLRGRRVPTRRQKGRHGLATADPQGPANA